MSINKERLSKMIETITAVATTAITSGSLLVATVNLDKAQLCTEQMCHPVLVGKNTPKGELLVKQIAGAVARRICNYAIVDKEVKQNDELGFIKFGSRVDILLPPGTKVEVELNQVVKNGVSVIASW